MIVCNLKNHLPPCVMSQELMGNWVDMQGQPVVAVAWAEYTRYQMYCEVSHFDAGLTTCQWGPWGFQILQKDPIKLFCSCICK